MNLNEAFRLRNRLKDRIRDLKETINAANFEKNEGEEEFTRRLDGKTLKETIELTDTLMDLLCAFSEAIEKANAVNRTDLVRMEALKQKLAFYTGIVQRCRKTNAYENELVYDENDSFKRVKVVKVLVLDQPSIVEKCNAIRSERDKLDSKLARQNAKIQVEFDYSEIEKVL